MANGRSVALRLKNSSLRGPKLRHIRLQRSGCPSSMPHGGLEKQPGCLTGVQRSSQAGIITSPLIKIQLARRNSRGENYKLNFLKGSSKDPKEEMTFLVILKKTTKVDYTITMMLYSIRRLHTSSTVYLYRITLKMILLNREEKGGQLGGCQVWQTNDAQQCSYALLLRQSDKSVCHPQKLFVLGLD